MKILLGEILKKRNKSVRSFAKEAGIDNSVLQKIVNNKTISIKFSNLEKICIALNCTPNDILQIER